VNGVFWSVAAEWKIYFLLPCFVLLWRRSPRLMLATAMLIGLGLIPLLHLAFPANNLSRACPWYVALFAMGLAAAGLIFSNHGTVTKARAGAMLGIGALVFGLAAACFCTLFPPVRALSNLGTEVDWRMPVADLLVGAAVAGVLGWLAASVLAGRRNLLLRFFEFTPLVWLGMIGYSLYLMHPLALNFMVAIVHRVASGAQAQAILLFVGGVPAAVFFSYLFYLCVERQFLNSVPVRKPSTVKSPSLILQVPSETAPGNVA
jgi:peptidoglycan/LPS O-acetylase OafA/YrhL